MSKFRTEQADCRYACTRDFSILPARLVDQQPVALGYPPKPSPPPFWSPEPGRPAGSARVSGPRLGPSDEELAVWSWAGPVGLGVLVGRMK